MEQITQQELDYLLAARCLLLNRNVLHYKMDSIMRNLGVFWYFSCYDTPKPQLFFDFQICVACGAQQEVTSSHLGTYGCGQCDIIPTTINQSLLGYSLTESAKHIAGYQFRAMLEVYHRIRFTAIQRGIIHVSSA